MMRIFFELLMDHILKICPQLKSRPDVKQHDFIIFDCLDSEDLETRHQFQELKTQNQDLLKRLEYLESVVGSKH